MSIMLKWLDYIKSGLKRELPPDQYNKEANYGRIRDNLKFILPSVKNHWKEGLLSFSLLFCASIIAYPQPMVIKFLIDDVITEKRTELIIPVIALLAAIIFGTYLTGLLKNYYSMRFSQEVFLDLQEKLVKKILALPKLFFDKNRSGYLMTRIWSDIQGVNWFISGTLVNLIMAAFRLAGGIIFLFYLDWRLALPIVLTLPLSFIVLRYFAKHTYIMSHQSSELRAQSAAGLQETISSAPLIKSFSAENRALGKLLGMFRKNVEIGYERQSITNLSTGINQMMPALAQIAVFMFGAYWVIIGEWGLGTLIAYQSYLVYVYEPVNQLSSNINSLQSARATLDRIATMFGLVSEDNTDSGKIVGRLNGGIKFENVSFSYESNQIILKDISFEIKPGENWAIIGSSGSGKTTLISLILRFYKPLKGEIYYDGVPAVEYNVRALRDRFGYVSQRVALMTGTIMENLKYGNPDADDAEVIKAAQIADIHDFIEGLPDKYQTQIEEDADNLSEGQKQRIAIARALIKNPDIIIFDEPTSSLDNLTENSILQSLPKSLINKTTITIAHRLNTIKSADKIIFLRTGKAPIICTNEELTDNKDYLDLIANH